MSLLERIVGNVSGLFSAKGPPAAPSYSPYPDAAANSMYNLLFCDDVAAYRPEEPLKPPFSLIYAKEGNVPALQELAADEAQEGRIRYLAFGRLRAMKVPVPAKILLGVIVEVPLPGGLDVLAAYAEGGVRYINHTAKMAIVEGVESVRGKVGSLFQIAGPVLARMGAWGKDKLRGPPPPEGQLRLCFLASDGLYIGEAPKEVMEAGAMGGPIIRQAAELLNAVSALATRGA